ncbi:cupin domain-containing protein [Roseomonas frigidaquae]|uniref:Cupin domain-containing protein n=1 Tax=Falsiroseomonas frigidaquae TaxID=487318 RepID=A0ABX1F5D7_9PROT|nr:cupin domain-containing protein [Falsiroseomonas frigidaquae]NKE47543.1 cupin domain-containing protein [Falsiroseomonas frigidaquae]
MTAATPFDPLGLPESNATGYPEPYAATARLRWNRRLGDAAGLTQFGVNLTRIAPGGQSSQRHWHLKEDEFVYVLEGEPVLHTDAGEQLLRPGQCVGFPAGHPDGHCLINRGDRDVLLLVVGSRMPGEVSTYPDIDMQVGPGADGVRRFTRKDGTPY